MTIPEDVRKTARAVADQFKGHKLARDYFVPFIARAILAERQRCADIAKKVAEEEYGDTSAIGAAGLIRGRILSP